MPAVKEEQPYDRMPVYNLSKWDIFKQFLTLHRISIVSLIVAVIALIHDIR